MPKKPKAMLVAKMAAKVALRIQVMQFWALPEDKRPSKREIARRLKISEGGVRRILKTWGPGSGHKKGAVPLDKTRVGRPKKCSPRCGLCFSCWY